MKHIGALLLVWILTIVPVFAQQETPEKITAGSVSGTVVDSAGDQPLAYCPVHIRRDPRDSSGFAARSLNADSNGHFLFSAIPPGRYQLQLFYAGYQQQSVEVTVSASGDADLGLIRMKGQVMRLKEVEVTAKKPLIEQKPEGLVYHAEQDAGNVGNTAEELLKKVPMVTVDQEGNLKLRGSSNIRVLIDGKPSTLVAASVRDAIRQLPADQIKTVEVLTSPGARYDAEGTAGVINIVTKKSFAKGVSGNVYSSVSYRPDLDKFTTHQGVNLTYRRGKLGLSGYGGGGHWESRGIVTSDRTDMPGTASENRLSQRARNDNRGDYYYGGLTADYRIDSLQSVQAGVNLNTGNPSSENRLVSQLTRPFSETQRNISSGPNRYGTLSGNLAYTRKFRDDQGPEFTFLSQYSHAPGLERYGLDQYPLSSRKDVYRETNRNERTLNELTVQADYIHPLRKNRKFETGAKYIRRMVVSDYRLLSGSGAGELVEDPQRTNGLDYSQDVTAAYGQITSPLARQLSATLGARYEYTNIDGNLRDRGGHFSGTFGNLLPNAILVYQLKQYNTLKLSYNQRIERPSIDYVNPFINYTDPYNLSYGNPSLVPEKAHNIELGYGGALAKVLSINAAVFYRFTGNAIESVSELFPDGATHRTYRNIGTNRTVGLNLYLGGMVANKLVFNLSGNVYYRDLESRALAISNSGWQFDGNLFAACGLGKGFSLEGNGYYGGRQIQLQGVSTGWYSYSIGLKKEVLQKKGSVVLRADNPFTERIFMVSDLNFGASRYRNGYNHYGRGITLAFTYNFGKMKYLQTKKVLNDDLKGGGGQQGGGQQQ